MVAGCGANCMKYTLFFFNVIFFLSGLCMVGFGATMLALLDQVVAGVDRDDFDVGKIATITAIVFMIAGFILMAICFFGCCGAIKEIKCMLGTYAVLVGIVIIGELAVVIIFAVYKEKFQTPVITQVKYEIERASLRRYTGDSDDLDTQKLDDLQKGNCCGIDSYEDYEKYAKLWRKRNEYKVPISCCMLKNKDGDLKKSNLQDPRCPVKPTPLNSYIAKPCLASIGTTETTADAPWAPFIQLVFLSIVAVVVGLVAIELIGLIFSVCLIRMIGEPRAVPV